MANAETLSEEPKKPEKLTEMEQIYRLYASKLKTATGSERERLISEIDNMLMEQRDKFLESPEYANVYSSWSMD